MEKIKAAFMDLMKHKAEFTYAITRTLLAFLFFLGIVLPLAVDPAIINNHVSLAQLPAGGIGIIIALVLMFGQFYTLMMRDVKLYKLSVLIQLIFVTVVFLYGLLFKTVGFDFAATGIGFTLVILVTIIVWVLKFLENKILDFLQSKIGTQATPAPVTEVALEPEPQVVATPAPQEAPEVVSEPEVVKEVEPIVTVEPEAIQEATPPEEPEIVQDAVPVAEEPVEVSQPEEIKEETPPVEKKEE